MAPANHAASVDTPDAPDSLVWTILEAVAEREAKNVAHLPPLGRSINPEALDALFTFRPNGIQRDGGVVTFDYCGYTVAAHADGRVTLDSTQ